MVAVVVLLVETLKGLVVLEVLVRCVLQLGTLSLQELPIASRLLVEVVVQLLG